MDYTEEDLDKCRGGVDLWKCPVESCTYLLSRKQILKSHLFVKHNIRAGNAPKRYKLYDWDPSVPIPRRTLYERNHVSQCPTGLPHTSCSSTSEETSPPVTGNHQTSENIAACSSTSEEDLPAVDHSTSGDLYVINTSNTADITDYDGPSTMEDGDGGMDLCAPNLDSDSTMDISSASDSDTEDLCDDSKQGYADNSPPLYVIEPSDKIQSSSITHSQHVLAICSYALKHNISGTAFADVAKAIQLHLPENNLCETDVNEIKRLCGYDKETLTVHEYCAKCSGLFSDNSDGNCPTPGCSGKKSKEKAISDKNNIFISTSLESQISSVLQRDGNFEKIQASKKNTGECLNDITAGALYQQLKNDEGFLHDVENNNVTLTCFTDGVPLFKSSKVSLWPMYLVINELPPNERFLKKNMLLWGIWQGVSKPQMNSFLCPFVKDLQKLHSTGFNFNIDGVEMTGKACLIVATMDLQARAPTVNMTHHNGQYGCLYCEIPGKVVPSGKGYARTYPYPLEVTHTARTDESLAMNSDIAVENKKPSVGIHGPSVLSAVPEFSIVYGTVIDYMHGTLLGIVKKLLKLWFAGSNYKEAYFLGHKTDVINIILKSIKPPYVLRRLPRRIEDSHHWKASELRSWLLYYSIPCLIGILPDVYVSHYACLVESIFLLLGDHIAECELTRADLLLKSFYEHCATLYSDNIVGLNVHNLIHLADCVRNWGPLWAYSCFGFESFNADVLKLVHGTGNVSHQIIWSLNAQKHLELEAKTLPDGPLKSFFKDMLQGSSKSLPKGIQARHCRLVKPFECDSNLTESVNTSFQQYLELDHPLSKSDLLKCNKIVYGQIIIYSKGCTRVKKRNSYTVEISPLLDGSDIMQVQYFLMHKISKKVVAVCTLFKRTSSAVRGRAIHCQRVEHTRHNAVVPVTINTIRDIVVYTEGHNGCSFVSRIPNFVERD